MRWKFFFSFENSIGAWCDMNEFWFLLPNYVLFFDLFLFTFSPFIIVITIFHETRNLPVRFYKRSLRSRSLTYAVELYFPCTASSVGTSRVRERQPAREMYGENITVEKIVSQLVSRILLVCYLNESFVHLCQLSVFNLIFAF